MNHDYILKTLNAHLNPEGFIVRPLEGKFRVVGNGTLQGYANLKDLVLAYTECFSKADLESWGIVLRKEFTKPKIHLNDAELENPEIMSVVLKMDRLDEIHTHHPDLYSTNMHLARQKCVIDLQQLRQNYQQQVKTPAEPVFQQQKKIYDIPKMSRSLSRDLQRQEIIEYTPELLISSDKRSTPKCGKDIHNELVVMKVVKAGQYDYNIVNKVLDFCVTKGIVLRTGKTRSTLYRHPMIHL